VSSFIFEPAFVSQFLKSLNVSFIGYEHIYTIVYINIRVYILIKLGRTNI